MFQIIGYYQGGNEVIDEAETMTEAIYLQGEYQLAYGNAWTLVIRKDKLPRPVKTGCACCVTLCGCACHLG